MTISGISPTCDQISDGGIRTIDRLWETVDLQQLRTSKVTPSMIVSDIYSLILKFVLRYYVTRKGAVLRCCFKVLLDDAIFLELATKSMYVAICTFFMENVYFCTCPVLSYSNE